MKRLLFLFEVTNDKVFQRRIFRIHIRLGTPVFGRPYKCHIECCHKAFLCNTSYPPPPSMAVGIPAFVFAFNSAPSPPFCGTVERSFMSRSLFFKASPFPLSPFPPFILDFRFLFSCEKPLIKICQVFHGKLMTFIFIIH